jgi:hypothetical protein
MSESRSDDDAVVTFIAHFGLEHSQECRIEVGHETVDSPYKLTNELGPKSGPYQLVKVTFLRALAARMLPGYSDSDVVNPKVFDFSDVSDEIEPGQSIDEWLRCFQDQWTTKQLCPDPRMYEVAHSSWLTEIGGSAGEYTHFLLLGHDAYVEVIAQGYEWNSLGAV